MSQKRIFLSRVSGEFSNLVDFIRVEGNKAFSTLVITDQNHPPKIVDKRISTITVKKIWEWLRASDHVFLYVGLLPGAGAKVPPSEQEKLVNLLDPHSQSELASLLEKFDAAKISHSELTYTQLEGILAVGLRKEPLVFWLEEGKPQGSQAVYRSWIRDRYLSGRDRIQARDEVGLIQGSQRRLQELHTRALLERLNRSAVDSPLWETIRLLAQPEASEDDFLQKSAEIRGYEQSTKVDWIVSRIECCETLPDYVVRSLEESDEERDRHWLFLGPESSTILSDCDGLWKKKGIEGTSVAHRAECFHEGSFWSLSEKDGVCYLRRLEPVTPSEEHAISDFSFTSFDPVFLLHSGSKFHISVGDRIHALEMVPGASDLAARRVETLIHDLSSNSRPVFPEPYAFPFSRGFSGSVYECQPSGEKRWALVQTETRVIHVRIRPGNFLDAFQTVDVSLSGIWEALEVDVCDNGICGIKIRSGGQDFATLPLFPNSGFKITNWRKHQCRVILFKAALEGTGTTYEIVPNVQSNFEPFCFFNREIEENPGSTRFRVWLLPSVLNPSILDLLDSLINGTEPLPPTPIRDLSDSSPIALSENWWQALWNYPFHNVSATP